jgi:hypothetical protein
MSSTTFGKSTEHFDKAKEAGSEAVDKVKQAGKEAIGAAKDAGTEALAGAKDMGASVMDKAKESLSSAGEMASNAATAVGQKADNLTAAAGHEIKGLGVTIARKTPHEGMAGAASQAVAEGIKEGGRYLEQAKLSGMAHDVEGIIKNHPIPALLICFGLGFCLARAIKD